MKKETEKRIGFWSLPDIDSPGLRRLALVFLIFVFLMFDILFYLDGNVGNGSNDTARNVSRIPSLSAARKGYRRMVSGYPIERMVPYISLQNGQVASFLLAIAKKESDWGTYSPRKEGKDCYNYWGYRGTYNRTASGYSCFDSPRQAVAVVGGRIEDLIGQRIDTPKEMIVWKCGQDCRGHKRSDVKKWISDVGMYVDKVNDISS